jgi:ketol-acid reductoisomerase
MANYFNSLPLRLQLEQLGVCEFMDQSEFADGIKALKKKVVIVGCGAQFESRIEHEIQD